MENRIIILLLFMSSLSYSQNWRTNFEETKQEAFKQNKNILLVFAGSDWCGPCIKLDNVVWKSEAFKLERKKPINCQLNLPKAIINWPKSTIGMAVFPSLFFWIKMEKSLE